MNLADPELELIDPTPNVRSLFIQFDKMFFWTKIAGRAVIKWNKRMYEWAGVCSFPGRGPCYISLSEPLLKLRPRKDLVEILLHEMIHAFLFVTSPVRDRDHHGPDFIAHMNRINSAAGLNITIYHNFLEEFELYRAWWRCDGPCQWKKPHFGILSRSTNRAPGPSDCWWFDHLRQCGGKFIKFKESEKNAKKTAIAKPKGDITKYVETTKHIKAPVGEPKIQVPVKNKVPAKPVIKSNSSSTVVVTNEVLSLGDPVVKQPTGFNNTKKGTKHKADSIHADSPPVKVKKIDNYLKTTENSLLKDIYGDNIEIAESNNSKKFIAVHNTSVSSPKLVKVDCPICKLKVDENYVNNHLDECLNKDIISNLSAGNEMTQSNISGGVRTNKLPPIKLEPGSSSGVSGTEQKCPCCGDKVTKALGEHLDECLAFFVNGTEPEQGASTGFANETIVIDDEDDDELDESQLFNETGTKLPCPCCLQMVENADMNAHLDNCLS